ncbi:MAG: phosphate/phosphite/phosphonate ABC transporter substrate-binding protein [Alphaproteobacteria bacterium]
MPTQGFSQNELGRLRSLINPDGTTSLERIPADGGAAGTGDIVGTTGPVGDDSGETRNLIPPAERKPTFRIGIVPRGDVARLLDDLEPMRKALIKLLARPVEVLPIASLGALIDAQVLKRVDLAFLSTSAFVTADQLCRCVDPLVAPLASDGTISGYALIVTRRGSGLSSLSDLEGKAVAAAATDSIAGRIYQLASLKAEGIDPEAFFGALNTTGSTIDAVMDMRDGLADAAFAWSSLAGPVSSGYTRGTFTALLGQAAIGMNEIQIIWKSRPLTHGPVSVLKSIADEDKQALTAFFVEMAEKDPATYDILDAVYGGGYQPILPSDYHGASVLARQSVDAAAGVAALPIPRLRPAPPDRPALPAPPTAPNRPLSSIQLPSPNSAPDPLLPANPAAGEIRGSRTIPGAVAPLSPSPGAFEPEQNSTIFLPIPSNSKAQPAN